MAETLPELTWASVAPADPHAVWHLMPRRGWHGTICGVEMPRETRYSESEPLDGHRCASCTAFADAQARSYPGDPS